MSAIHREPELNWPDLRWAIGLAKSDVVGKLLRGGTEQERLAFAPELEAYVKNLPAERWWASHQPGPAVAIAAFGCLPSAARAAALFSRRGLREQWHLLPVADLIEMARVRELTWLGDLARRLAGKLRRDPNPGEWALVAGLLAEAGVDPPTDDAFVRGWLGHLLGWSRHDDRPPLLDRMRTDPYLDLLLPRLFEVDGLGTELARRGWDQQTRRWSDQPAVPYALVALAAEGRVDRSALLDGVLGRFLRGDRVAALRPFVVLHDALAPTEVELAERVTQYARLLPDAHSTVAALAQRALRQVDDAGRLELDTLLHSSGQLLARPEKMLVKAQLSWLDQVARRERDRAGEVAETVAVAFGHDALDVQERALSIVLRHAAQCQPATRERLAEQAVELAGDLPARAAEVLGRPAAATAVAVPAGLPLVPMPLVVPMPPPVTGAAELAEEIGALLHSQDSMICWERVLAGLVACHTSEPAELRDALVPMLDRYDVQFRTGHVLGKPRLRQLLGEAIRAAVRVDTGLTGWESAIRTVRTAFRTAPAALPEIGYGPGPGRVLAVRVAEMAVRTRHSPVPMLVATPSRANGQLDATVLVDRLAQAEREGWQPWRFDLEQALLRVPTEVDGDALSRAAALRSPAGLRLAAWLADGGAPHPVSVRVEQRRPAVRLFDHWQLSQLPERRVVVGTRPGATQHGELGQELFEVDPPDRPVLEFSDPEYQLWPAVLPNHREVVAAWSLPAFAGLADNDQRGADLLPLLAETAGPVGPAVTLALAYTLAARHETDRVAGVDALLALAAAGDLDGVALGRELGALAAGGGTIKLTRVVTGLAEAARAGATTTVWAAIEAALPAVLATTPRGAPDLLALGARTAGEVAEKADPGPLRAELAEIVARGGSGRLVTEARRLDRVLGG
ncbi:hypothetical protein BDK92_2059 [Micromonospora pisi]|uniref:Secreted protein n=1 Tax=Micromonospora pisi TaxID=589240 RepID=A0A495JFS8_9ACTN|nr:DUF6493 family protein [Micromonospora pisi]RKR87767.1 hypothetical protein BDK92_2059 [Micromonospora pisi]